MSSTTNTELPAPAAVDIKDVAKKLVAAANKANSGSFTNDRLLSFFPIADITQIKDINEFLIVNSEGDLIDLGYITIKAISSEPKFSMADSSSVVFAYPQFIQFQPKRIRHSDYGNCVIRR